MAAGATLDLSTACASGNQARARALLEEDPERARSLDSGRWSPLTYAARAGHLDALDDEYRGTPLAWAARKGHEATVRFLLGHGADPALPRDLPPAPPLARARSAGHEEIVTILGRVIG